MSFRFIFMTFYLLLSPFRADSRGMGPTCQALLDSAGSVALRHRFVAAFQAPPALGAVAAAFGIDCREWRPVTAESVLEDWSRQNLWTRRRGQSVQGLVWEVFL